MTIHSTEPRPTITTMSQAEIRGEISRLEAAHGSFDSLREKAERDALSAEERVAYRRLDSLRFLLSA